MNHGGTLNETPMRYDITAEGQRPVYASDPDKNTEVYVLPSGREVSLPKTYTQPQVDAAIRQHIDSDIAALTRQSQRESEQGTIQRGYSRYIGDPLTRAASGLIGGAFGPYMAGAELDAEQERSIGEPAAEFLVPQTPLEAGIGLGTMGASIVAKPLVKAISRVGTRVAGGAVGGEAGNLLEGGTPGRGALLGSIGATAGEAGGALAAKGTELVRRAWGHFTDAVYSSDAMKAAKWLGQVAPSLKGAKNTQDLRDMVLSGEGREKLFKMLEAGYDFVGQKIENGLQAQIQQLAQAWARQGVTPAQAAARIGKPLNIPSLGGKVTWEELHEALTSSVRRAYLTPPNPKAPTPAAMPSPSTQDARVAFANLMREARPEIARVGGRDALRVFLDVRQEFRVGINAIDLMKTANGETNRLFPASGNTVRFETQRLQEAMNAQQGNLRKRMGKAQFDEFHNLMLRGAKAGAKDQDLSLGNLMGRYYTRGNLGISERTPGLTAPYFVGNPRPYETSVPSGVQSLIDTLGGVTAARFDQ